MKTREMFLAAVIIAAGVAACHSEGDSPSPGTPSTGAASSGSISSGSDVADARVLLDVDVGGSDTDIYLPVAGDGAVPVVVMLHGTANDRSRMAELASAVADDGALVYVPAWPVIDQVEQFPEEQGGELYRMQSEAVICTLRSIKTTATDLGGDPADLTVVGHSGGGMIGARVAIVDEPPWPGIDCNADVDHQPNRFIGLAGDYRGWYQYSLPHGDIYAPYDVLGLEPTNLDLEVRLLHGHNDTTLNVFDSAVLIDHLRSAGIDAELLTTDTDHATPLDIDGVVGQFTADRISAIVHGVSETEWWPDGPPEATMSFDDAEVCAYDGPATWPTDRAITILLQNRTDHEVQFALVSIRTDAAWTEELVLAGDGDLGVDDPDWVDWGGFRPVPPQAERTMAFAFVEADQAFAAYCHLGPEVDHPRANWMYPAAVLRPAVR